MSYKTYEEQIHEHLRFLASKGLQVDQLEVAGEFVRCRSVGQINGRGEHSYKTTQSTMENGCVGLATWCRGEGGIQETFKTYGLPPNGSESFVSTLALQPIANDYDEAARRAYGFWMRSDDEGESPYLKNKHVCAHGVRYRNTPEYGKSIVIPMFDVDRKLWNYQIINADGTKINGKGGKTEGLFCPLKDFSDGQLIGLAESYSTAATCMENTGIPCLCCFGCNNLIPVTKALLDRYPHSKFIIFADNDRHLEKNQGIEKATEAQDLCPERIEVAIPEFGRIPISKKASDWNDLFVINEQSGLRKTDIFAKYRNLAKMI